MYNFSAQVHFFQLNQLKQCFGLFAQTSSHRAQNDKFSLALQIT